MNKFKLNEYKDNQPTTKQKGKKIFPSTVTSQTGLSNFVTVWVVPSDEAFEVPPNVCRFSVFDTTFLNVAATSCDFNLAHNYSRKKMKLIEKKPLVFVRHTNSDDSILRVQILQMIVALCQVPTVPGRPLRSSTGLGTMEFWIRKHPAPVSTRPIRCNPIHLDQSVFKI
jgi:hypothetical protein